MREKSDLHVYRGIEPSPPGPIMGHEFMGEIVEVGNAVTTLQKGDRVVSAFTTSWYVTCCLIAVELQLLLIIIENLTCWQWQVFLLQARVLVTLREEHALWMRASGRWPSSICVFLSSHPLK